MSRIFTDKVAYHEDWKDGMNAFRQRMIEEIDKMNEKLNKLEQQIKGDPK
jgi:hypothetical protein